ncbi:MAG: Gfo/Idh/MocA family oxidoreductase [Phycisphaeraceae bacterium]
MSSKSIGYALIGAGAFGQFCVEQYRAMSSLRLVALADVNRDAAEAAAAKLGVPAAASVAAVLADPAVDLVHIATPPTTHRQLVLQALAAGKHVLCEKPLATTLDDARAMIDAAHQAQRVLAVNLIMRYDPLCEVMNCIVEEKMLGLPLHGFFENYAKDEPLPPQHWFWDRGKSGGIFIEHAVHFFDLFNWWLGEGSVVAAQQVHRPGNAALIEQVHCTARYPQAGGALVNFYHGFTQATRMDRQEMRLLFERGTVRLFEWVPTAIEIDCLAEEAVLDRLRTLLPHGQVETLATYQGGQRQVASRHKCYTVDGRYRLTADAGMDKPALYGHVLRSLLQDQLDAIGNSGHQRRITERNGYASLATAVAAQRLADDNEA